MSYSITHRQAGVTRGNVAGLVRHNFRDVDYWDEASTEVEHSNEKIIPERTVHNESVIFIDGEPTELDSTQEILDELDRRLSIAGGTRVSKDGTKKRIGVRKDAKVVREIILQLDPEFTRSSEHLVEDSAGNVEVFRHRTRVEDLMWNMVDYYGEVYGRQNLLAASLHFDETSPHMHLMITPIDDEGRVRQESFIPSGRGSKSGMHKNDRSLRQFIKEHGYEVDEEPRGGGRRHMTKDQYSDWMKREDAVKEKEIQLADKENSLLRKERVLQRLEKDFSQRKEDLDHQEREIYSRVNELNDRESELNSQERNVEGMLSMVEDQQEEIDSIRDEVIRKEEQLVTELKSARRARQTFQEAEKVLITTNEAMRAYNGALKAHTRVLKPGGRPEVDRASKGLLEASTAYKEAMPRLNPAIARANAFLDTPRSVAEESTHFTVEDGEEFS